MQFLVKYAILSCGGNVAGAWGTPREALGELPDRLQRAGIAVKAISPFYRTPPIGPVRQPSFLNVVLVIAVDLPPARFLTLLKQLEREAGRRRGVHWGPRPLDIDIVDFGGLIVGWPLLGGGRRRLVLPHPEAHRRAFVLRPTADVAPAWRHPVLGLRAAQLLRRLGPRAAHGVVQLPDPAGVDRAAGQPVPRNA